MTIFLAIAAALLLPLFLNTLANAATFKPLPAAPKDWVGLVSVLVPARNEAARLGPLLESFSALDEGTPLELVVYDDDSEDGTAELVRSFAARDSRIRLVEGHGLPAGWGGKVHALHRLSEEAHGTFLLFVDADVTLHAGCVRDSLAAMADNRLDVLSLYPRQVLVSPGERIFVPCMVYYFHLLGSQWLLALRGKPQVVALNGQFMLWRRAAYEAVGGYASIKQAWLDDMIIAARAVACGLRVRYRPAHGLASCRMYTSFSEAWRGFAKHSWDSFSQPAPIYLLAHLWLAWALVAPWLAPVSLLWRPFTPLEWQIWGAIAAMTAVTRVISCAQAGGGWLSALLHPVSMAGALANGLYSYHLSRLRTSAWKGRTRAGTASTPSPSET